MLFFNSIAVYTLALDLQVSPVSGDISLECLMFGADGGAMLPLVRRDSNISSSSQPSAMVR